MKKNNNDIKTLYHYCNNNSFTAIVESRSIHLSSLSLANDTLEGRLVSQSIMRLADHDKLDQLTKEKLRDNLRFLEEFFDGLGFCLSEEDDLLSQWRGYADGARGIAIGFSKEYLEKLSKNSPPTTPGLRLLKVEYDLNAHDTSTEPTYKELIELINKGALRFGVPKGILMRQMKATSEIEAEQKKEEEAYRQLLYKILGLFPKLFELKASAFREEKEWRLVSILSNGLDDNCKFRGISDRVIPYRQLTLPSMNDIAAINEVVLGPKNLTPLKIITLMLKKSGFGDVSVRRSEASFR